MFNQSNYFGKIAERQVIFSLFGKFYNENQIFGYEIPPDNTIEKRFDIIFYNINHKKLFSVEVKHDAHDTGNLFIEVIYNKEPSGILASQSEYLAYTFEKDDFIYIIRIEKLLNYLKTEPDIKIDDSEGLDYWAYSISERPPRQPNNKKIILVAAGDNKLSYGYLVSIKDLEIKNLIEHKVNKVIHIPDTVPESFYMFEYRKEIPENLKSSGEYFAKFLATS